MINLIYLLFPSLALMVIASHPEESYSDITYEGDSESTPVMLGDCTPFEKDGHHANSIDFHESVRCHIYSDTNCEELDATFEILSNGKQDLQNILKNSGSFSCDEL
ncbi:uncharacterized protein BX664DRAFT_311846 [Halteromyces radiatus]|uniref:uncharacterized protein n=1 Tax=Halteromyces radiatus TaxID=101107 RepID=UPI002220C9F6|nr:uncharacterized protein BX664DRAFT_311846 [Halteromyces radiatus]KAI8096952.1 hypothetical protein BX664DRAFT_311846 [Halteromyces radiatus]